MQKKLMTLAVVFALAVACSLRGFAAEPLSNADGEIYTAEQTEAVSLTQTVNEQKEYASQPNEDKNVVNSASSDVSGDNGSQSDVATSSSENGNLDGSVPTDGADESGSDTSTDSSDGSASIDGTDESGSDTSTDSSNSSASTDGTDESGSDTSTDSSNSSASTDGTDESGSDASTDSSDSSASTDGADESGSDTSADSSASSDVSDGAMNGAFEEYGNGSNKSGWVTEIINGVEAVVYYYPDGTKAKGFQKIDGKYYLFRDDGSREWGNNGRFTYKNNEYYIDNGEVKVEWVTYKYNGQDMMSYFWPNTGIMAQGIVRIHGDSYLMRDDGGREWGNEDQFVYHNNIYFVGQGKVGLGWKEYSHNGQPMVSYFWPNTGIMAQGLAKIDGQYYLFRDDGGREWGNGDQYTYHDTTYFVEEGKVGTGWENYKQNGVDTVSYFDPDTAAMAKGVKLIDGKGYFFREDGGREWGNNGRFVDQDKTYFISNGELQVGWICYQYNGKDMVSYFWPNTGIMATGFNKIEDDYYLFREDGGREWGNNGRFNYNNNNYFIVDGKAQVNWATYKYNGQDMVSYFWPNTGIMALGFVQIGEDYYLFRPDGAREWGNSGITDVNGQKYYIVNGKAQVGWIYCDINGNREQTYFWQSTGTMALGPNWIAQEYCFFDERGARIWDSVTKYDNRYYFVRDGRIVVNEVVTINGKTYKADEHGVLIGFSEMKGIDVSSAQGVIDWSKVKADGVDFVIVRAMHWSNSANNYVMDSMFVQNVYGAKTAGLLVGAYWFSEAFNGNEALQEVQFIANSAEWNNLKNAGIVLDMPFFIDYEDVNWLERHTTYESRTEAVRTGMDATEQLLGTQSGFYTSDSYAQTWFAGQQLINEGYNAWVARWSSSSPTTSGYELWQYSNKGSVNGINGNVDLNYAYVTYTFHPITNYTGNYTTITVYDENTKKDVTGNIIEITKQIVANEVGGAFGLTGRDRAELYKAQAVAAHSYLVSILNRGEKPSVGLKVFEGFASLNDAVESVKNQMLVYNGSVINAVYTASTGTHTNSTANMGWGDYAYLTPVESKYDSKYDLGYYIGDKKYSTYPWSYTTNQTQMANSIQKMTGYAPAGAPSTWISVKTDAHGNVVSVVTNTSAGQKSVTPDKFLSDCLGVISLNIETFTYANGVWTIKSYGQGHGVGMSQCGAAGYIVEGWNYQQVLEHYYSGAKVL